MREASKATIRRMREDSEGIFPWRQVFKGKGLDIGAGDDPLPFPDCQPFDKEDGDANKLSEYFKPNTFDYIHASQVLEHMYSPRDALRDWLIIVKPKGYVVCTVPDMVTYEGLHWPSRYNPDHKATFSTLYKGSIAPIHVHIPTMLKELEDVAETKLMRYIEENYDWKIWVREDQTWEPDKMVECWNEFVVRKK